MLDKIKGGLYGVAIGDALGGTTEFMTKEEIAEQYGQVTEIIGGGCWDLKVGETTDDTAMTIAVAKGITENAENPIEEIGKYFLQWQDTDPIDIGITIRTVFNNYKGDWFKAAEITHHLLNGKSAGNGSLMRCLPIALVYANLQQMVDITVLHSKMTHYDDLASEACVIYNKIAKRLHDNEDIQSAIKAEIKNTKYDLNYENEPECLPSGYVVDTMKWVLYWLLKSNSFEEVVIGATNMGHDSDTVAAIAGGLKGIEVGFRNLPNQYANKILDKEEISEIAEDLYKMRVKTK